MIFVTGGTGFIGSRLLFDLTEGGKPVRALKRKTSVIPSFLRDRNIEWVEGDVLHVGALEEAMQGAQKVYHCAAMVSLANRERRQMYRVNIQGTANVVNLCLALGVEKLAHVSSVAGLGREKDGKFITEKTLFDYDEQNWAYGISKYESECEVWRGVAEGLNAVVINPTIVLADKDWSQGSGRMFGVVKKGMRFYTPGANGYVDVRDVSSCLIALMENGASGERFIINAENRSYREVFSAIAGALGKPQPSFQLKRWMLEIAWRANLVYALITGKEPLISKDAVKAGFRETRYSNEKIKKATGIHFIPLEQTIRDIVNEHEVHH
ncbi:nucleoside-diphosphate-sugar epimerase [Anseongella ginsenosidimutans]|uniref:Nucleoside-diphosphate-sugar epimerase n=1 Tax=Anseongella ginsenosidimutans TaxID=496056 RepID=A0A4R3L0Q2_9SPHI|nr:NAD-dependent epimerase/dehydratase family protein [Anseongella ginsenosidimutans]QEC51332.1 NAD-dependent epimerase/dehydratase family protein [Anseongella ginsenosidimutans]TCS89972.1 nucleoside-diphosphate-sugar epimerase [Anseongella ginsenosidimutans]